MTLRLSYLYRNMFLAQTRFRSHFFSAFLTPNQNSFALIICKDHPESRLETSILRQKSDDKRTLGYFLVQLQLEKTLTLNNAAIILRLGQIKKKQFESNLWFYKFKSQTITTLK